MIGIMELGCGSFVEMEWPFFLFIVNFLITHSMLDPHQRIFCFTSRNSSSTWLGQNSRASTSISSLTKKRSSSLICLLTAIVDSRENR